MAHEHILVSRQDTSHKAPVQLESTEHMLSRWACIPFPTSASSQDGLEMESGGAGHQPQRVPFSLLSLEEDYLSRHVQHSRPVGKVSPVGPAFSFEKRLGHVEKGTVRN